MSDCGYLSDWTDECRKPGCPKCSELVFELLPPAGCICKAELHGFVTVAQHEETCPLHGRCRCGSGAMRYDDHREVDYFPREWRPACPLIDHRQDRS